MVRKGVGRVFLYSGLALSCLVLLSVAFASSSVGGLPVSAETRVDAQRSVRYFFSDEAWGGLPFSEADKQQAMVDAMLSGQPVRLEADVLHLLSAPEARVRSFVAVFEVDGGVRPPTLRAGYELELLVPHRSEALSVELINAETGVVNLVQVAPEGEP